jgi:GrpB-like predicted nucleotidyltransferase (UPF0157 family)
VRLDPIVIHPYDSAWAEAFERERRRIAPALSPWVVRGIEHIGSTAVPGRPAKAIIDMLAVVSDVHEVQGAIEATMDIGWFLAPEPGDELDRRISFCFPSIEKRTHHLHVVEQRSDSWLGWLAFRDYLMAHDDVAAAYAALKERLAVEHGSDPDERRPTGPGRPLSSGTSWTGRAGTATPVQIQTEPRPKPGRHDIRRYAARTAVDPGRESSRRV